MSKMQKQDEISYANSSLRSVRAGIVGTGYIADYHARAVRMLKAVELVSVCDVSLASAQSFAARWKIPSAFGSLDAMISNSELDSVHVLAPPDAHFPLVK